MTTSAKFFFTLLSASLLLTACQNKDAQPAPATTKTSQVSSSAIAKASKTSSSSLTTTSQDDAAASSEASDASPEAEAQEEVAEETSPAVEEAASISVPEQLVGSWEVNQDGWVTRLTYGADGSVIKEVLDLDGQTVSYWQSSIGQFYDLGNGAVRFDELGGDWETVAQTGLGGGFQIHTGAILNQDGSISTKVWQFETGQNPSADDYTTDGGVRMTRIN